MDKFIYTAEYGQLYYDEVFWYYDEPCIFSVIDILAHKYICLLENEMDNGRKYVVAPVSISRYSQLVRNQISIRKIYTKPEINKVFSLVVKNESVKIEELTIDIIEKLNIPEDDIYLDIKDSYTYNDLLSESAEKNVPIMKKSFEKEGGHRRFIFANEMSSISSNLQGVFSGEASDYIRVNNIKNVDEQKWIRKKANVPLFGTYAASFGITIEGAEFAEIGEQEIMFSKFIDTYFELLSINESCTDTFFDEHRDGLKALRKYYRALMAQGFSVKCTAATPSHKFYKKHLTREYIFNQYAILNSKMAQDIEQEKYHGKWRKIDIEKKRFRFQTDKEIIEGKFDDNFDESIFDFERDIDILVEKSICTDRIGENKEKYTLLSIL